MPDSFLIFQLFRLAPLALVTVLAGCATSSTVRGEFNLDLRAQGQRRDLVWPKPPDPPRYRYVGELLGEQNFTRGGNADTSAAGIMNWLVGLMEDNNPIRLQRPQHGMVTDSGRIYVVDGGRSAVVVFDPKPPADGKSDKDGGQLMVWDGREGTTGFGTPVAIAEVWDGDIAVSDSKLGVVLRLNSKGELVGEIGGTQLQRPTGLAFDKKRGLLYVADTVASDIKVYDRSGLLADTVGTPGQDDGQLNSPTFLAFEDDHLYVTDTLNSRVQVFDIDGRRVRGFGERGLYVGNMARPKGVAVGGHGIVYVVESYYGYLLAYNDKSQLLLGIGGNGANEDRFTLPSGVWTDKNKRVYVADMFNSRVVMFDLISAD